MNKGLLKGWLLVVTFIASALIWTACEPDDESIKAEVLVLNQDDRLVPDAWVVLYCDGPKCVVKDSALSNSKGVAAFEFDFPAVLFVDVRVTLVEDSIAGTTAIPVERNYIGKGVVTLEEGKTVDETVVIERDI